MHEWANRRSRIYWYDQYALNEQETAFARYDPDRITEELVSVGAEIVALYAANQFGVAYYPSDLWPMHPGLRGRDYFGELCTRLQARGIRVVAYINWLNSRRADWNLIPLGCEDRSRYDEQRLASWADPADPDRRVQALPGGGWRFSCPLSPQRGQVVEISREILERYRPDGFHLDMFHGLPICVCERCRAALTPILGTGEITAAAIEAHWQEYIDWRCRESAAVIAGISTVLRQHGVVAAHNAGVPFLPVSYGFSEEWLPHLDVMVSEAFDAFLCHPTDLNATSIAVRLARGMGIPPWILRTSAQIHHAHWPISAAQWRLYAAACKANGCRAFGPCGIGAYPDTTTARRMLAHVKVGFDAYMEDADLDEGARPVARVALVFSWATRRYFGSGRANGSVAWCEEFMGWARVLMEEHLPYEIVVVERITSAENLAAYDLVVLPGTCHLSDGFCAAVRGYVEQGGRVLVTGETSLGDERGNRRADFALAELLGIHWQGSSTGPFAVERPVDPEPATGVLQQVAAVGQVVIGSLAVDPAGSVAGVEDPLPRATTGWPLVIEHATGQGRTLYVAFDLGRRATLHGDEHLEALMIELVDRLLPERQVRVSGPRTVEVTVWEQPDQHRTIVHLANRTVAHTLPTDQRQIREIVAVHDLVVRLRRTGTEARVSARQAEVAWSREGDELVIRVARLDDYAALVVEG